MIASLAGVIVGAVLCFAGAAKVAKGVQWPVEARAMRAPTVVIPVLPWFEIGIGALVAARVAPQWTGLGALVLLIAFTSLIVVNLRAGLRPACACFGSWRATPLGWRHVARNLVLMALAGVSILA